MRQLFWACLARLLSRWTWLTERMIWSAFNRPHHLQLTGYMSRWWLLPRTRWLPFALRIHHIHREDRGADLHNHPGTFRTIVLRGWYIEQRLDGLLYPRNAGDSALMPKKEFHKIVFVPRGGVVTLVIEWGFWKGKGWGFLVDSEYVEHDDYHGNR